MSPFVTSSSPEREGYSRIGIYGRQVGQRNLLISAALIVCALLVAVALITVLAVRTTFRTLHHRLNVSNQDLTSPIVISKAELGESPEVPFVLDADLFEDVYLKARSEVELEEEQDDTHIDCINDEMAYVALFHQFPNADGPESKEESSVEGKTRERAARIVKEKLHLTNLQVNAGLQVDGADRNSSTSRHLSCNETYRSYDGSCNNLLHQQWGAASVSYRRVLLPDYADGISEPRISSDQFRPLPNARVVSIKILLDSKPVRDRDRNSLMTFWGEFVARDLSKVASNAFCLASRSEFRPIDVTSDPFFSSVNVTRLPFVRSNIAIHPDCVLGPRQQVNLVTSYLDGSVIYGSSKEESVALRTLNGQMKSSVFDEPASKSSDPSHPPKNASAGDGRCNENLWLASLHTVWVREHNRISSELRELNPWWSDDRLFEESRRLIVAELQHVTYNEYLPKLLGATALSEAGLRLQTNGYYTNYSMNVDPTIANEFSTAAFRFGHSTIDGLLQLVDSDGVKHVQLSKMITPSLIKQETGLLGSFLLGASKQMSLSVGPFYNKQLGNRLFQGKRDSAGLDLAAIDIQRGREHGIPSYNRFRKFCGLSELQSGRDLETVFGGKMAEKLIKVYGNVEDIDLLVGGLAEPRASGSLLGPTFACLVADQFSRLRRSDRHWYENGFGVAPIPFTERQLAEVRKTSFARIICDNVPHIKKLQPDVFSVPFRRNSLVPCKSDKMPRVNIVYWYEEDENYVDHYDDDETSDYNLKV